MNIPLLGLLVYRRRMSLAESSSSKFYKQKKGLVSKETVVLRRWGSETQNFGFIN